MDHCWQDALFRKISMMIYKDIWFCLIWRRQKCFRVGRGGLSLRLLGFSRRKIKRDRRDKREKRMRKIIYRHKSNNKNNFKNKKINLIDKGNKDEDFEWTDRDSGNKIPIWSLEIYDKRCTNCKTNPSYYQTPNKTCNSNKKCRNPQNKNNSN